MKLTPQKTTGMGLLYGENFVILASTVFDWSSRVTDGRTDGQTELPWHIRANYSIYTVARKKTVVYHLVSGVVTHWKQQKW